MNASEVFVLLAAGTAGGIFSTVVSVASLITYPALLALGVPPLVANVTNTVSLVLTGAGSVAGSKPELTGQYRMVLRLAVVTALGGATGAAVLLLAPASTFTAVVPILIGGASVVLLVQPKLTRFAATVPAAATGPAATVPATTRPAASAEPAASAAPAGQPRTDSHPHLEVRPRGARLIALFAAALYIGYFGAAGGVMLMVVLGTMIAQPIVRVNAIKNAVSGAANLMAAVLFTIFGSVRWLFVPPLAAGFLLGGWLGPKIARRLPGGALRLLACLAGLGLAVHLGLSAYR